ncbi:MAG: hypothetical protein Q9M16_09190 [Mariprofundus sp.]|nr:hypothetical protein [Mariprofundus sp.]
MKLNTSKILAQLSQQDRNKVELELAELNVHKQRLVNQQQTSIVRIQQLNQQRDQAMKQRNAASLLQVFNLSLNEQQAMLAAIHGGLQALEQQQVILLEKFSSAFRKHHSCESMHEKNVRQQRRQQSHKQQRQLDDLFASRRPAAAA